jgi:hypothetical protein
MAHRFALGDGAVAEFEGAFLAGDAARASTVGTGLCGAELLGLLFQQRGQGALGHALGGGGGDLLHDVEIDIESRAGVAEGVAGHNFAPAGSEVTDVLELLSGELTLWHSQACLVLAKSGKYAFLLALYRTILCLAKQVLTS